MAVLWLSIVSFADFAAAGKQPAEYPDPGLIQVVDKNKRIYWGAEARRRASKLGVPRVPRSAWCRRPDPKLKPLVKGL